MQLRRNHHYRLTARSSLDHPAILTQPFRCTPSRLQEMRCRPILRTCMLHARQ